MSLVSITPFTKAICSELSIIFLKTIILQSPPNLLSKIDSDTLVIKVSFFRLYDIKSEIEPILILCFFENLIRSGNLAISPLSFIISQITPDGFELASLAISTTASVCPALIKVPPSFAISGKTCPGVVISLLNACLFIAVFIVSDLSAAEIPVVTPSLDSIETVNAVSNLPSFLLSINERPNFSD